VQADFGIVIFLISASQVARMTDVRWQAWATGFTSPPHLVQCWMDLPSKRP
jgi:hypothetical protein